MELSLCMNGIRKRLGTYWGRSIEESAALCARAGFYYADYTPDFELDNWRENALRERDILDRAGITVEQTHAPYNRYGAHDGKPFWTYYDRTFEMSKIMGAKYVVVHADEYRTVDHYDEKEIEDYTYDYLAPYVDYAVKNGLTVAIESVFEDRIRRRPEFDGKSRYTSRLHELERIITRFNDPAVKCCWDFGHSYLAFGKDGMVQALKHMGKYVCCTHVHDNYYGKDLHLLPFSGDICWEDQMTALREIGYKGQLSFENGYERFPDELMPGWLNHAAGIGRYLIDLYNQAPAAE